MYCSQCGNWLSEEMAVCPQCGKPAPAPHPVSYPTTPAPERPIVEPDNGSAGWWFLGFFFPVVGLILFLVWQDSRPRNAKRAGWGALIGVIAGVVFVLLMIVLVGVGAVLFESSFPSYFSV